MFYKAIIWAIQKARGDYSRMKKGKKKVITIFCLRRYTKNCQLSGNILPYNQSNI